VTSPADELLLRLEAATERLRGLASRDPAPGALTDADGRTGERWDWGQVWAHLAEFPPYWMAQVRTLLARPGDEPVPFGRVASDPDRIAAVERDRSTPTKELWVRLFTDLDELRRLIGELRPEDWEREGLHQALGVMAMPRIFEEFLVGHLESHARQLESLLPG